MSDVDFPRRIWSHSTLSLHQECPRKFEFVVMRNLVPKGTARSLSFGAAYHVGMTVWYQTMGKTPEEILELAAMFERNRRSEYEQEQDSLPEALRSPYTPALDLVHLKKAAKKENVREELMVAMALNALPELSDAQAGDRRTHELLEKILRAYAKVYAYEPFKVLYVERDVVFPLNEEHDYRVVLDLVVEWGGTIPAIEHKTTSSLYDFGEKWNPEHQVSGEILALRTTVEGAANQLIINAALVNKRRDGSVDPHKDFQRYTNIYRTDEQLNEFVMDQLATIDDIATNIRRGYFPKNTRSCHNYSGCQFRPICSAASAEERQLITQHYYEVVPYDPERWKKGRGHLI